MGFTLPTILIGSVLYLSMHFALSPLIQIFKAAKVCHARWQATPIVLSFLQHISSILGSLLSERKDVSNMVSWALQEKESPWQQLFVAAQKAVNQLRPGWFSMP